MAERGFAQSEATPQRPGAPLYGNRARFADSIGGPANLARLNEIAAAHNLRLGRTADHKAALALLCKETGEDLLRMGEETLTPPSYGSRGRPAATDTARQICMQEAAAEEIKKIPLSEPGRVGIGWRRAAHLYPQLAPSDYGWPRRARS